MTRTAKTVPIVLDRARNMRLTLRDALAYRDATVTAERPHGVSLLFGALPEDEEDWLLLLHRTLVWEDADLTVEELPDLIDACQFRAAHEALAELLAAFLPAGGAGTPGPSGTA